jgi:paired amphipathic helix protein Sin3a
MGALAQTSQSSHQARDGPKMPPVGNFAPPASAGKEGKKRPRPDKSAAAATPVLDVPTSSARGTIPPTGPGSKRAKLSHKAAADGPSVEPTLTPVMPEPLQPTSYAVETQEGLIFFDRVKKYLGNRTTNVEFLKLINMFNQELIDVNVLIAKSNHFLGGNPELLEWLKKFVGYTGDDESLDNAPPPPTGKISLSNCRGYGPSYRLLPKRVRV